jgi:hypothetical protein
VTHIDEMTFTDDDLKRLKEDIKPHNAWYSTIIPLLSRLEAAEEVCEASEKVVRPTKRIGDAPLERAIFDALKAWRKAAGK